jgi:hypothetical protein
LLDSGVVYRTEGSKVRSLPVDKLGEPPADLATLQNDPRGIATHGDDIYWTNAGDGSVWRAKKDGSAPRAIANGESEPVGIAVDDAGAVYLTNHGHGHLRGVRPQ